MDFLNSFKSKVFKTNIQNFEEHALSLFYWQARHNPVYADYLRHLGCNARRIDSIERIPFLPIRFFKLNDVRSGSFNAVQVFESSGTTGTNTSRHAIEDAGFYNQVSESIFTNFFGEISGAVVLGLLPSYLERNNSSLVSMVNHFIKQSGQPASGFYLDNYEGLFQNLKRAHEIGSRVFLFGVTFALLEFAAKYSLDMPGLTILETGGMKGHGREMIRDELHEVLRGSFAGSIVSSEYGMTELLSQSYLLQDGFFHTPPWMRVLMRDIHDPFQFLPSGRHGGINVIDLANAHSCAFIETEDLGLSSGNGFTVMGRLDNSDIRGCNLLV